MILHGSNLSRSGASDQPGAVQVVISGSTKLKPEVVAAICDRASGAALVNCKNDGAIWWLENDTADFVGQVQEMWASGDYPEIYLMGGTIGFGYLFFLSSMFQLSPPVRAHLPSVMQPVQLHIAAFGLATVPLYVVAIDWGRWFSLWYVSGILYCLIGESVGVLSRRVRLSAMGQSWMVALPIAVLSLFWALPLCCDSTPSLAEKLGHAFSCAYSECVDEDEEE